MTPRIRIFIISLVLSFLFCLGINNFEEKLSDFLFWHRISQDSRILAAQISLEQKWQEMKPIKKKETTEPAITAKAAISIFVNDQGGEKILFEKESGQKLAIASLTKLMTGWVVLEHYDLSREIIVSEKAAGQYGDIKALQPGRTFPVEYLLYPLLMESSNGAAFALADDYPGMTARKFVDLMNSEAEKIGLASTFFDNPTGLDPEDSKTEMNYSTAADLAKLVERLLGKPLIWEILSIPKYAEYGPELISTNKFLTIDSSWQEKIIGGKTGYTSRAGGCLLLVLKAPRNQGFIINIILGSNGKEDRFEEMEKLIDWLNQAYKW